MYFNAALNNQILFPKNSKTLNPVNGLQLMGTVYKMT